VRWARRRESILNEVHSLGQCSLVFVLACMGYIAMSGLTVSLHNWTLTFTSHLTMNDSNACPQPQWVMALSAMVDNGQQTSIIGQQSFISPQVNRVQPPAITITEPESADNLVLRQSPKLDVNSELLALLDDNSVRPSTSAFVAAPPVREAAKKSGKPLGKVPTTTTTVKAAPSVSETVFLEPISCQLKPFIEAGQIKYQGRNKSRQRRNASEEPWWCSWFKIKLCKDITLSPSSRKSSSFVAAVSI
jgi:hypothetical protein